MPLLLDLEEAVTDRIDEEAKAENISRELWIRLAINQKLRTLGMHELPENSPDEPHMQPEEIQVLREQVKRLRTILRTKDDEILWLRWELEKLQDRLEELAHESFWECISRYSRKIAPPSESGQIHSA